MTEYTSSYFTDEQYSGGHGDVIRLRVKVSVTYTETASTYTVKNPELQIEVKSSQAGRAVTLSNLAFTLSDGTTFSASGTSTTCTNANTWYALSVTGSNTATRSKGASFAVKITNVTARAISTSTGANVIAIDGESGYSARTLFTVPQATQTYTLTYKPNGASGSDQTQTKTHGIAITLKSATAFTRTGYAFKRWNTSSTDTGTAYNASATYTGNAALTLYAIWNRTVSFNANGGTGAPASQTAVATSAITLTTSKPTRDGYSFKEWNTKADGTGTGYGSGGSYSAGSASATLYAQWTPIVSSLTIGTAKVIRVDSASSTTEADEGEFAYITVPFTCKGAAAATVTLTGVTVTADSGSAPAITLVSTSASKAAGSDKTGTFTARASGCDVNVRYIFTANVSAANTSATQTAVTASKSVVLPMAFYTMDVLAGGHGVAFGKPATRQALDIGMSTFIDSKILNMKSSNLDRDGTPPSSNTSGNSYLRFMDKDEETLATLFTNRDTNGRTRVYLAVYGEDENNATISNFPYTWLNTTGQMQTFLGKHILYLRSTNLDRDGEDPDEIVDGDAYLYFVDKDTEQVGFIRPRRDANGTQMLHFQVGNENDANAQTLGWFDLKRTKTGYTQLDMVGHFRPRSTNIDRDAANPTSQAAGNARITFIDNNEEVLGYIYPVRETDGRQRLLIQVANEKSDGTGVYNGISLYVAKDGTATYGITSPSNFCSALHVGDTVNADQTTNISFASGTYMNLCAVSMTAGVWVVSGNMTFASNATGIRVCSLSQTSATVNNACVMNTNAVSGATTRINISRVLTLSSAATTFLVGWQNSGSDINVTGYIRAVRIK